MDSEELEKIIDSEGMDLAKIKNLSDLANIPDALLYDESGDNSDFKLMPNLTDEEIDDALFWKDHARGLMLVLGEEGSGKTMFGHMLAYKMNKYFGLTLVSDTRPRKLFGRYVPFSEAFLVEQSDRMWEVATGQIKEDKLRDPDLPLVRPHITPDGKWVSSRGDVLIQRSVLLLDEFGSKYMNRREPNNPIHRTLLFKILPLWRHLGSLIIGMTPSLDFIDPLCDEKITSEAHCERALVLDSKSNALIPDSLVFRVHIKPRRSITPLGEYGYAPSDVFIDMDAKEPKDMLGGNAWKDLYNHRQAVALEMPKSMRRKKQ